jgi:hypothetical protein
VRGIRVQSNASAISIRAAFSSLTINMQIKFRYRL